MKECLDCGEYSKVLLKDPRIPPLSEGKCLCIDCLYDSIQEVIEEKENEIDELKILLEGARE